MREARREHLRLVKKLLPWLASVVVVVLALGVGALVWRPGTSTGFVVGVLWASTGWAVTMLIQQLAGTGPKIMGDTAELWTSEELRVLDRQGWRTVDRFLLRGEDVDHVTVGPAGVFAIETKWSARRWTNRHYMLAAAARQARRNARGVGLRVFGGQHNNRVRPIVVVWGEADSLVPVDGVPVLHGSQLVGWLRSQPPQAGVDAVAIAGDLERHQTVRRAHEQLTDAPSRYEEVGVTGLVLDMTSALGAGLGTMLAAGYALVVFDRVGLAVPLVSFIAGLILRHRGRREVGSAMAVAGGGIAAICVLLVLTF